MSFEIRTETNDDVIRLIVEINGKHRCISFTKECLFEEWLPNAIKSSFNNMIDDVFTDDSKKEETPCKKEKPKKYDSYEKIYSCLLSQAEIVKEIMENIDA